MRVTFLAARERVRSWARRMAVYTGVLCLHTIDPKYWRPAVAALGMHGRYCSMCEQFELLSEAEYYAQFGRVPTFSSKATR